MSQREYDSTHIFLDRVSPELAAEHLEDLLADPAALGERGEGEVVRVHLAQACNINMNCQEKSSKLALIYKDYHIYPFVPQTRYALRPSPPSLFAVQSVLCRIEHFCEVRVRSRPAETHPQPEYGEAPRRPPSMGGRQTASLAAGFSAQGDDQDALALNTNYFITLFKIQFHSLS